MLSKPPPSPIYIYIFFIWNSSQLLYSGVQEYMYSLFNAEGSLVYVCMYVYLPACLYVVYSMCMYHVCVCVQISSLKPLGQLKPNLMWNLRGIGEESLFKWSRSFAVLHSLKPLGQLKPNLMWNLRGIGEESLFKWSRSFAVLHYCQPPWGRGFLQGFYHKFVPAVQGV